ncbi:putative serine protease K12H4.7 [Plutella xylostella]|uniref:putative serine protease K12H4.7 n=1 Tax=Plutella xylostella TaxID=51655 RepID=UPI0020326269|nr:putative serine protease K12H4.7 [Plutella xylostella]
MFLRIFVLCLVVGLVYSSRQFRLGRSRDGNLGSPGDYAGEKLPEERWMEQKLDHFSPTDLRTWKQRYFINDTFFDYENPGPIFIMIGGEGPLDARWMVKGAWIEYAQKFKAMCLSLEHRYYGKSHPTEDLSTKNLQYLSSHQALADLANFISTKTNDFKLVKEVKWIAFGGSYPGSLAAWLRMKYPHLVHGAISSSGPLLAKLNFMEYFQVVVHALSEKTQSDECVNQVKAAHKQVATLFKSNPTIIEKEFRVCKPFSQASDKDKRNFFNAIADDFAGLVQYNEDNRIGANETYKNLTINTVCQMLTADGGRPAYKKLAAFHSIMLDKTKEPCLDYSYKSMIDEMSNTRWSNDSGRQWFYQTCTEFGFYQTSSADVAEVFGNQFTLDFFTQQCQDVFGPKFNENFIEDATVFTNTDYGALDIDASRVVYVHGTVDPWHALGITKTRDQYAPAILIKGTAHCANMYPSSDSDLLELKRARLDIQQFISVWLDMP